MKKVKLSIASLLLAGSSFAQTVATHAIFVNGGVYGTTGSTSVVSYDIAEGTAFVIDSPMTSTVQALLVDGTIAYVAADDSLFAYDLVENKRVAAVNHRLDYASEDGLAKDFCMVGGKLLMSKQSPATADFVDVINPSDLSYESSIDGIGAEAADMVLIGDSLYVAVPGGWSATEGNISVIAINDMTVKRTIALGTNGAGLGNICAVDGKLYGFISASSDWNTGETFPGHVAIIDPVANTTEYVEVTNLGSGYSSASNIIGVDGSAVFFRNNGNIAKFNTADNTVTDFIPGLSNLQTGIFDPVAEKLFVLTGNFASLENGAGYVYNANDGTKLAEFGNVTASPEQIALFTMPEVDTTDSVDVTTVLAEADGQVALYPNPAQAEVTIVGYENSSVAVYSANGLRVLSATGTSFDVSCLPAGVYTVLIVANGAVSTQTLIVE